MKENAPPIKLTVIGVLVAVAVFWIGAVFAASDGRRCTSSIIATGLLAQALGRHRRADEVRKAVLTAAGRRA